MELKEYLEQLNGLMTKLSESASVEAAANVQVEKKGLEAKMEQVNKDLAERNHNNVMADSLYKVASLDKTLTHWGSNSFLDNPRGSLTKRGPDGRYLIPDHEIGRAIKLLLAAGKGNSGREMGDRERERFEQASKGLNGQSGQLISKALDTTTGAPLIRTDLEPMIYEATLRAAPALDLIDKVPANGLVHSYDVRTALPAATTVNDIGDFSGAFVNSTFVRSANSRIAVIVAPTAIALKLRNAVGQSGMSFDLDGTSNIETVGALYSVALKDQSLMLQGNSSVAGKTLNDEEGLYNALDYDGFRLILKGAGYSINKAGGDSYNYTFNRAIAQIANAGGNVDQMVIMGSYGARLALNAELEQYFRVTNEVPGQGFATNLSANGMVTVADKLARFATVPASAQGQGTGYYTLATVATEDVTVFDPSGCQMAYLGSPTTTILELPMGYNNTLSQVYVPFVMHGLVVHIAGFQRKVRIPQVVI